jgi:hypothetical protein
MNKNAPYFILFLLCLGIATFAAPRFSLPPTLPRLVPAVYPLCDSITTKKLKDSLQIEEWCDTTGSHGIFGYRFMLYGDFNGDGKTDTLIEKYTDSLGNNIPKYFGENDIGTNQCFEHKCGMRNFLCNTNGNSDSIPLRHLCFAENLGHLNGDGTDEIGFISSNGDYSSLSSYHIYTFKKERWNELLYIPTWEWMFPPTPVNPSSYYMFGHFKDTLITTDTLNQRLEKEMNEFDFVKNLGNGVIEFEMRNDTINENFYSAADAVWIRYNLKNNSFKIALPEHVPNQETLDELNIKYKKTGKYEFQVGANTYYAK